MIDTNIVTVEFTEPDKGVEFDEIRNGLWFCTGGKSLYLKVSDSKVWSASALAIQPATIFNFTPPIRIVDKIEIKVTC